MLRKYANLLKKAEYVVLEDSKAWGVSHDWLLGVDIKFSVPKPMGFWRAMDGLLDVISMFEVESVEVEDDKLIITARDHVRKKFTIIADMDTKEFYDKKKKYESKKYKLWGALSTIKERATDLIIIHYGYKYYVLSRYHYEKWSLVETIRAESYTDKPVMILYVRGEKLTILKNLPSSTIYYSEDRECCKADGLDFVYYFDNVPVTEEDLYNILLDAGVIVYNKAICSDIIQLCNELSGQITPYKKWDEYFHECCRLEPFSLLLFKINNIREKAEKGECLDKDLKTLERIKSTWRTLKSYFYFAEKVLESKLFDEDEELKELLTRLAKMIARLEDADVMELQSVLLQIRYRYTQIESSKPVSSKNLEEKVIAELSKKLKMYKPPYSYPPAELREQAMKIINRLLKEAGLDKYHKFEYHGRIFDLERLKEKIYLSWINGWNPKEIIKNVKPVKEKKEVIEMVKETYKNVPEEFLKKLEQLIEEHRKMRKEIEELKKKIAQYEKPKPVTIERKPTPSEEKEFAEEVKPPHLEEDGLAKLRHIVATTSTTSLKRYYRSPEVYLPQFVRKLGKETVREVIRKELEARGESPTEEAVPVAGVVGLPPVVAGIPPAFRNIPEELLSKKLTELFEPSDLRILLMIPGTHQNMTLEEYIRQLVKVERARYTSQELINTVKAIIEELTYK